MGGNDDMEIFDYPGLHTTPSDGTALVKVRMQEEEAIHKIVAGVERLPGIYQRLQIRS